MSKVIKKRIAEICVYARKDSSLNAKKINSISGLYPVYSASIGICIGHINYYLNESPCIVIPTAGNGSAGRPYIVKDKEYSIATNAVGIIPKDNIDIGYLYSQIKNTIEGLVKGLSFKSINKSMIDDIVISIPIKKDGTFDIEEQQRLAGIYSEIENQKQKLLNKVSEIQELLVQIDKEEGVNYKDVPLNKLVEHNNGSASYTKTWCQNHRGKYALFSANNFEPIDFIDSYDYDGEYLTYSKNGCAGYITIINEKFSVNGDRCVITINDEYKNMLDILYLKYYLEPLFRKNKKGRLGIYGKNEFTKLNSNMIKELDIQIPIPLDKDGQFDLEKQKEIADKYKQIDEIKQGLIDQIDYLTSINVIPEFAEE